MIQARTPNITQGWEAILCRIKYVSLKHKYYRLFKKYTIKISHVASYNMEDYTHKYKNQKLNIHATARGRGKQIKTTLNSTAISNIDTDCKDSDTLK